MFWEEFQTKKHKHLDIVFNQPKTKTDWTKFQYLNFLKARNISRSFKFFRNILIATFVLGLCFFNNRFANKVDAPIGYFVAKATTEEERRQMEKELAAIESQIALYEKELQGTTKEKTTLQNTINTLKTQANKLSLQVKSTKGQITTLTGKIQDTEVAIDKTLNNIDNAKKELSSLIQAFYELSTKSQAEIILANNTLSDYFTEVNSLNLLDLKINSKLGELKDLNKNLVAQKTNLNEKKGDAQNMLQVQLLQQNELDRTKKEKDTLLTATKNKEATFQQILSEQRKKAAELRSRIYNMVGIQTKVTFGEALDIATWAGNLIGVRPAMLLAILTQETNLGQNVGTCNRPTDPPNKSYKVIMNPKDHDYFVQVTKELGMNPEATPVSCPMYQQGKQVGWGGAMGPAQFIPRTWISYKSRVSSATGRNPSNPWDIKDAFVACALYIGDYGAKSKSYDGEWRSAMIYFSGSTNTRFRFYGDNVMAIAKRYQADIDAIKKVQ